MKNSKIVYTFDTICKISNKYLITFGYIWCCFDTFLKFLKRILFNFYSKTLIDRNEKIRKIYWIFHAKWSKRIVKTLKRKVRNFVKKSVWCVWLLPRIVTARSSWKRKKRRIFIASLIVKHSKNEKAKKKKEKERELSLRSVNVSFS